MEIEIDLSTDSAELLEIIKGELNALKKIVDNIEIKVKLDKIILTDDLEHRVNEFYGSDSFQAKRNTGKNDLHVISKYCKNDKFGALFITSSVYNYPDMRVRFYFYLHEIMHTINEKMIVEPPKENSTKDSYFFTLYWLYNEYSADRSAFMIIDEVFENSDSKWKLFLISQFDGYIDILVDDKNYEFFKAEITKFRIGQITINEFINATRQRSTDLSATIIHALAILHQYPELDYTHNISESRFINQKTNVLIEFIRQKYECSVTDLTDGLEIVTQYLTNFGFRFEELESGPYCHIVDI